MQLSPKVVGGLVRVARKQAGLTQAELAEAAEVSDETIRRIELGNYEGSLSTTVSIAKALNVTVERLTGSTDAAEGPGGFPPLVRRLAAEASLFPPAVQRSLLNLLQEMRAGSAAPLAGVAPTQTKRRAPNRRR